ncbi:MAG: flagellar assembly protein FliH [Magnetospirillum gryphiswaldense]|nr:flagellar assembly protein FliH [Magnetospirillum gryphiswaldense]
MAERKYMFDLDFDRPHPEKPAPAEMEVEHEPEPEPEPPPPMFSEEELLLTREAAYAEGHEAGMAEASAATERALAVAVSTLTQQMEQVHRQQEEANDANARAAVRVAMSILKKMLPAACEAHAFEEVTRVVEEVVGHVLDEPRIIVRVAAPLVDGVREQLEAVVQGRGFEGRVVVQADDRLDLGDCRVEWTDGGAERDQARLMADIEAAVEHALAPPERRRESDAE